MSKKKTVEKMNQTLSIKSRSEESLLLEEKKREITERLEAVMAEYAKATVKKHLARKSKKDTDEVYDAVKLVIEDVL